MAIDIYWYTAFPAIDTSPDVACGSISRTHWTFRPQVQDRPVTVGRSPTTTMKYTHIYICMYNIMYVCMHIYILLYTYVLIYLFDMWIVWYMCTVYMCVHVCVCTHICILCIVHAWRVWHKIMIYFRYKLYCGSAPLRPTRRGWHLWFLPPGFPVNITSGLVQEQLVVPNLEVPNRSLRDVRRVWG